MITKAMGDSCTDLISNLYNCLQLFYFEPKFTPFGISTWCRKNGSRCEKLSRGLNSPGFTDESGLLFNAPKVAYERPSNCWRTEYVLLLLYENILEFEPHEASLFVFA